MAKNVLIAGLLGAPAALLALTAVSLSAQAPGSDIGAGRAIELLASPQWADQAWGAYAAGRLHDPALHELLIEHLRRARPSSPQSSAGTYSPEFAYNAALFDALIQDGGIVPLDALKPFSRPQPQNGFFVQALILLSRSPGRAEDTLLSLADAPELQCPASALCSVDLYWLAVNDLLLAMRSPRFFGKTLAEIRITSGFEVWDRPPATIGGGTGGSIATSSHPSWPNGFPPVGLYYLADRPVPGSVALVPGVQAVDYVRMVPPARYDAGFRNAGRQQFRLEFLAAWNHREVVEAGRVFTPVTKVQWSNAAALSNAIKQRLDAQEADIRAYVAEAKRNGAPDLASIKLEIVPSIDDRRLARSTPLPGPPEPRSVTFN
jgi:hypothetical protein